MHATGTKAHKGIKTMTAKTLAQRQAEYYRRQIAKGLKYVSMWVNADMVKALREYARTLNITDKEPKP